ncbi:MAG: class II aldolase/adducin family protein [Pseudomonadota bacterium]
MTDSERATRRAILAQCRAMTASGLSQGMSGNISVRWREGLLITPTSLPYDRMMPEDLVFLCRDGTAEGPRRPSSEWRFHRDILAARPDARAVVHTHAPYATVLAILGREIPPLHYMVAVAGGATVPLAPYALFGTQALSDAVVGALAGRTACLMQHHGMIAIGSTLEEAMWRAGEVEALARQYHGCLALGQEPPLLSAAEIETVLQKMAASGYGAHRG